MPNFESGTFAVGLIFPYQHPLPSKVLHNWLIERDFTLIDQESQQHVSISPQGMEVDGEEGIAKKGDIRILYNPDANLHGFGSGSFITAKNVEEVSSDASLEVIGDLYEWIGSEIGAADDIATIEVTLNGLHRNSSQSNLSNLFNTETMDLVGQMGGNPGKGVTARFDSDGDPSTSNWYSLLIDRNASGNPNLWGIKCVRRFDSIDEIGVNELEGAIDDIIGYAKGDQ